MFVSSLSQLYAAMQSQNPHFARVLCCSWNGANILATAPRKDPPPAFWYAGDVFGRSGVVCAIIEAMTGVTLRSSPIATREVCENFKTNFVVGGLETACIPPGLAAAAQIKRLLLEDVLAGLVEQEDGGGGLEGETGDEGGFGSPARGGPSRGGPSRGGLISKDPSERMENDPFYVSSSELSLWDAADFQYQPDARCVLQQRHDKWNLIRIQERDLGFLWLRLRTCCFEYLFTLVMTDFLGIISRGEQTLEEMLANVTCEKHGRGKQATLQPKKWRVDTPDGERTITCGVAAHQPRDLLEKTSTVYRVGSGRYTEKIQKNHPHRIFVVRRRFFSLCSICLVRHESASTTHRGIHPQNRFCQLSGRGFLTTCRHCHGLV